ncbi:MAG: hypothetical protein MUF00_14755 [Gemmatimonadaceae bacterium]|jgi:hypothetical protein|nr:hypothetical protein [Gemmatimonadaceae bacterium]
MPPAPPKGSAESRPGTGTRSARSAHGGRSYGRAKRNVATCESPCAGPLDTAHDRSAPDEPHRLLALLLALLVALVAVRVLPYIVGFPAFYDRWPQLSLLPHDWSLA